jgi:hypothetical protein
MARFMWRRQVLDLPEFAQRDCLLVRHWLPGLPHCYVLCHRPPRPPESPADRAQVLGFFLSQAHRLASEAVGDPEAFLLVYSGASIRKRAGLHVHLFIVQSRWRKAWAYGILAARNTLLALGQTLMPRAFRAAKTS